MAFLTAIGSLSAALAGPAGTGLGTLLTGAGAVAGAVGSAQAASASREAESIRKRQMMQESARRQREIYRQSMQARAQAVSNSTLSGVGLDSSAFGGAVGQIAGDVGRQSVALSENTQNSLDLFSANADQAQGETLSSFGRAASNLGQSIVSLKPEFQRIGETLYNNPRNPGSWQTSVYRG